MARPVMAMETPKELAAPVNGVIGEVVGSGPDRLCCISSASIRYKCRITYPDDAPVPDG